MIRLLPYPVRIMLGCAAMLTIFGGFLAAMLWWNGVVMGMSPVSHDPTIDAIAKWLIGMAPMLLVWTAGSRR